MHLSKMHIPLLSLLFPFSTALTLSLSIPPSQQLPNPSTLPSSTRATLYKLGTTLTAPLTRSNTFDFHALDTGSYLATIQCRDALFAPLRIDVADGRVDAWQTFRGNEWGNKGEWRGGGNVTAAEGVEDVVVVEVRASGRKEYYMPRQGFSVLGFLKNPMLLMALFSLVLIVGMPYLMDSMDDETRAEFEEMQSKGTLNKIAADPTAALGNFDLASWMAGGTKQGDASGGSSSGNDARGDAGDARAR